MCPNVHGRFNSNKSVADKVKDAAKEFKADGKIGSKFTSEGEVGKKFDQEVGGAFAKGKSLCKKKKKKPFGQCVLIRIRWCYWQAVREGRCRWRYRPEGSRED